jgi:hypothetical protein
VQQDVIEDIAAGAGGFHVELQLLFELGLPDELGQSLRAQ